MIMIQHWFVFASSSYLRASLPCLPLVPNILIFYSQSSKRCTEILFVKILKSQVYEYKGFLIYMERNLFRLTLRLWAFNRKAVAAGGFWKSVEEG